MRLQRQEMQEEIRRLPEARLKAEPLEAIARAVAAAYAIEMPALDEAAIHPERREIEIDFTTMFGERARKMGTEIIITVPFHGDGSVFRLHASSHSMEYPRGRVTDNAIVFRKQGVDLDAAQTRREFDQWLAAIKRHLDGMTRELGTFKDALRGEALATLNVRAGKLKRDDDLVAGLGFRPPRSAS